MNILHRIWTGVVAAVTGVAVAVLIVVIGLMTKILQIDSLIWIVIACASIGFLLGVVIGPRSTKQKTKL